MNRKKLFLIALIGITGASLFCSEKNEETDCSKTIALWEKEIPTDIIQHIGSFLPIYYFLNLRRLNKNWNKLFTYEPKVECIRLPLVIHNWGKQKELKLKQILPSGNNKILSSDFTAFLKKYQFHTLKINAHPSEVPKGFQDKINKKNKLEKLGIKYVRLQELDGAVTFEGLSTLELTGYYTTYPVSLNSILTFCTRHPKLKHLTLNAVDLEDKEAPKTEDAKKEEAVLAKLSTLTLDNTSFSTAAFNTLLQQTPQLAQLILAECFVKDKDGWKADQNTITTLNHITNLTIKKIRATDDELNNFLALCKNVITLTLESTAKIKPETLASYPNLKKCLLKGVPWNEQELTTFLEKTNLEEFHLVGNDTFAKVNKKLLKKIPHFFVSLSENKKIDLNDKNLKAITLDTTYCSDIANTLTFFLVNYPTIEQVTLKGSISEQITDENKFALSLLKNIKQLTLEVGALGTRPFSTTFIENMLKNTNALQSLTIDSIIGQEKVIVRERGTIKDLCSAYEIQNAQRIIKKLPNLHYVTTYPKSNFLNPANEKELKFIPSDPKDLSKIYWEALKCYNYLEKLDLSALSDDPSIKLPPVPFTILLKDRVIEPSLTQKVIQKIRRTQAFSRSFFTQAHDKAIACSKNSYVNGCLHISAFAIAGVAIWVATICATYATIVAFEKLFNSATTATPSLTLTTTLPSMDYLTTYRSGALPPMPTHMGLRNSTVPLHIKPLKLQ